MNTPWTDLPRLNESSRPTWTLPAGHPPVSSKPGLGQHLIQVHHHVRRETRKLLEVVAAVVQGRESAEAARTALENLSVRQNYPALGGFCSGYCELLTIHHTLEDHNVFPGLKRADPTLGPVLQQLHEEHQVVSRLMRRLDEVLAASSHDTDALGHLNFVSDSLAEQLLSHLDYEESQLVLALDAYAR